MHPIDGAGSPSILQHACTWQHSHALQCTSAHTSIACQLDSHELLQDRLKQFGKKVKKAAAAKELKESKRSMEVDVGAINRFISHAVPDLSSQQKQALAVAGAAAAMEPKGGRAQQQGGSSSAGKGKRKGDNSRDAALAFLDEVMADIQPGLGTQQKTK